MKYVLFIIIALAPFVACQKEKFTDPPPPPPPDTPSIYVPIYQPGDTSLGAAHAKKLTASWQAKAVCKIQSYFDTNYISVTLLTYSNNGAQRESFGFAFIPRFENNKVYGLKKMTGSTLIPNFVSPGYTTWTSDGDVFEDFYGLDTTATDNFFRVVSIDPVSNRMEGTFTATFKIEEPRRNPANPKTVKFSEGRFWAVIRN